MRGSSRKLSGASRGGNTKARAFVIFMTVMSATALLTAVGCSIVATRPVQEMSDTGAALRAAKEVQADTLAPELYRQAADFHFKARNEYKVKNFDLARRYALKARRYAEQAEFESIRSGGNRTAEVPPDPRAVAPPASEPYAYPSPAGTPAEAFEQRQAEEEAQRQEAQKKSGSGSRPTIPSSPNELKPPGT